MIDVLIYNSTIGLLERLAVLNFPFYSYRCTLRLLGASFLLPSGYLIDCITFNDIRNEQEARR